MPRVDMSGWSEMVSHLTQLTCEAKTPLVAIARTRGVDR
jgi:hypothetical protein